MAKTEREKAPAQQARSRIPHFKSVEEEAEFWDTHSTTEFEDEFEEVKEPIQFVVQRAPANKALTVRVDERTLAELTRRAAHQGIGPSTLVRTWILEHLRRPEGHTP